MNLEKTKNQKKIQSCNDISSIKILKNDDSEKQNNQSIIIKDYYRSNEGSTIQEVVLFLSKYKNIY